MTSILNTIKHMIGPSETYDYFDTDLIVHINSALATLTQLGVGPSTGFAITGDTETWDDFLGDDLRLGAVKSFVYLQCRLAFDPPQNSSILSSIKEQIAELTWRINVAAETP